MYVMINVRMNVMMVVTVITATMVMAMMTCWS